MKKNYNVIFLTLLALLAFSCGTDDNTTSLAIETNPDTIVLSQNSEIDVFIFQNDANIPSSGTLSVSAALKGSIIINFNNTPTDPSDDYVTYRSNANVTGEDSFQYTICDNSGNCATEHVSMTITSISVVNANLDDLPYQNLSEYNFFDGDLKDLNPNFGLVPYTLNSKLFSDYAKKKRFIWIPNNTKANYVSDDLPLDFPTGTILIKNFYYENVLPENQTRIIETRLMINKPEGWTFANYVWNNEQTQATIDMNGSFINLDWEENGQIHSVNYRIPAGPECHTCHKVMEISQPIGPKPRNLNLDYLYSDGQVNQLDKLVNIGYLENSIPSNISKLPNYNDDSEPIENRVRAYLDINCAHCHNEETHCSYRPMRFSYNDTEDLSNIGVCVEPDTDLGLGLGNIVIPGDPSNSVLYFRLNTSEESYRMPLMGRSLKHVEGVNLIEEWIDQLSIECD